MDLLDTTPNPALVIVPQSNKANQLAVGCGPVQTEGCTKMATTMWGVIDHKPRNSLVEVVS